MNGGLLINQIGELLVRRLAEAVQACAEDGRMRRDVKDEDARVADLYRLGEKLGIHRRDILLATKFAAARRWIDVVDLDEYRCQARLRPDGCEMLEQGGFTGILEENPGLPGQKRF